MRKDTYVLINVNPQHNDLFLKQFEGPAIVIGEFTVFEYAAEAWWTFKMLSTGQIYNLPDDGTFIFTEIAKEQALVESL